ncbi:MAG: hypothetical protein JWQ30_330 [Sediminibacterium sp.]|nr:hypothetical protein [Sediminibacterium sp.]
MKKLPLLPHSFQKLGFVLLIPFLVLGIANLGWDYDIPWLNYVVNKSGPNFSSSSTESLTDELAAVGNIVSMMLIAFSKERTEDEAIQFFRLASLQWAVIVNYIVLIVCILAIYGLDFFTIMMYNMFTTLIIFNIRFRAVLFMHNRAAK